ncbi:MAG TPA: hypothetical protein VHT00_01245 [Stellaceae bacterium]|nr:hypothetical protein [Stellaceae bacterium]
MSRKREPSLEDIDDAKTCLWVEQQLNRVRRFLIEQGGDEEMLDVVDYLLEENKTWLDPQLADDLRAGRLPEGEA